MADHLRQVIKDRAAWVLVANSETGAAQLAGLGMFLTLYLAARDRDPRRDLPPPTECATLVGFLTAVDRRLLYVGSAESNSGGRSRWTPPKDCCAS